MILTKEDEPFSEIIKGESSPLKEVKSEVCD